MIDDINLFSKNPNNWNYNPLLLNSDIDPDTGKQFNGNNSTYQPLKYSYRIILKKLLHYSSSLFSDEVKQHIYKICFNGPKSCYFKIVSYTSHILQYYLYYLKDNTTPSQLNYKAWRKFNINNKLYKQVCKKEKLEIANWLLEIKPGIDTRVLKK